MSQVGRQLGTSVSTVNSDMDRPDLRTVFTVRGWCHNWIMQFANLAAGRIDGCNSPIYPPAGASFIEVKWSRSECSEACLIGWSIEMQYLERSNAVAVFLTSNLWLTDQIIPLWSANTAKKTIFKHWESAKIALVSRITGLAILPLFILDYWSISGCHHQRCRYPKLMTANRTLCIREDISSSIRPLSEIQLHTWFCAFSLLYCFHPPTGTVRIWATPVLQHFTFWRCINGSERSHNDGDRHTVMITVVNKSVNHQDLWRCSDRQQAKGFSWSAPGSLTIRRCA